MTDHVDCRCGHDRPSHYQDGFAPQCTAAHCTCLRYQPGPEQPRLTAAPATPAKTHDPVPDLEVLLAAAAKSPVKRTAALGAKIRAETEELCDRLEAESGRAAALAEIAALEAQLAAAKARLHGKPAAIPLQPVAGKHTCPTCSEGFATPQGLGAHRARKHGYRRTA